MREVLKKDCLNTLFGNVKLINNMADITGTTLFTCDSAVPVGSVYLPKYTTGIVIYRYNDPNTDAVLMATDSTKKFYVSYRNNKEWGDAKIL